MREAKYAPIYCAMYPDLTKVVREHGYALCVHGSVQRDFDLVCIPWIEEPDSPEDVVASLVREFQLTPIGEPETRHHGRLIYTLSNGFGECFLDLSFMPIIKK